MHRALAIRWFRLEGQKASAPHVFVMGLPAKFRAAIVEDIERVAQLGLGATVSLRPITGFSPLWEIRVGDYRIFFVQDRGEMWVLHGCKKQDQKRAIRVAAERMKLVRER